MKNTVTISIEEHDRLREIEESLKEIIGHKFISIDSELSILYKIDELKEDGVIKTLIDKNSDLKDVNRSLRDEKYKLKKDINSLTSRIYEFNNPTYKYVKLFFCYYKRVVNNKYCYTKWR